MQKNVKNIKIDLVIIDEENGKEKYVFNSFGCCT